MWFCHHLSRRFSQLYFTAKQFVCNDILFSGKRKPNCLHNSGDIRQLSYRKTRYGKQTDFFLLSPQISYSAIGSLYVPAWHFIKWQQFARIVVKNDTWILSSLKLLRLITSYKEFCTKESGVSSFTWCDQTHLAVPWSGLLWVSQVVPELEWCQHYQDNAVILLLALPMPGGQTCQQSH